MTGYLIYKCRMCREQIIDRPVPDLRHAVAFAAADIRVPPHWPGSDYIAHTISHDCEGGLFGVADLIGGASERARLRTDARGT